MKGTPKTESSHGANFVVSDGTRGCRYDNWRWRQCTFKVGFMKLGFQHMHCIEICQVARQQSCRGTFHITSVNNTLRTSLSPSRFYEIFCRVNKPSNVIMRQNRAGIGPMPALPRLRIDSGTLAVARLQSGSGVLWHFLSSIFYMHMWNNHQKFIFVLNTWNALWMHIYIYKVIPANTFLSMNTNSLVKYAI